MEKRQSRCADHCYRQDSANNQSRPPKSNPKCCSFEVCGSSKEEVAADNGRRLCGPHFTTTCILARHDLTTPLSIIKHLAPRLSDMKGLSPAGPEMPMSDDSEQ